MRRRGYQVLLNFTPTDDRQDSHAQFYELSVTPYQRTLDPYGKLKKKEKDKEGRKEEITEEESVRGRWSIRSKNIPLLRIRYTLTHANSNAYLVCVANIIPPIGWRGALWNVNFKSIYKKILESKTSTRTEENPRLQTHTYIYIISHIHIHIHTFTHLHIHVHTHTHTRTHTRTHTHIYIHTQRDCSLKT